MVNSNFASSSIRQPSIAWPRPSTGSQVFAGLDLIAKIWPKSDSVYDLTAIDSGFAGWRQIHFVDQLFGPALDTLGHFIQDIGCFMYPTTLLPSRGKDYSVLPDSGYVTSSYLEGSNNHFATFGYNRDAKSGKMQIVIGLLCDQAGIPLSIEVFGGNTSDPKTVASQVKKIVGHFGCGSADR